MPELSYGGFRTNSPCFRVLDLGDEVITSAYTYTASASPVVHVGAKLVLVDTAPDSYEMDYDKLADAITEKTKAHYSSRHCWYSL
jgi:dTDP-4-amino-4,6-dideoxygalactose transaminase